MRNSCASALRISTHSAHAFITGPLRSKFLDHYTIDCIWQRIGKEIQDSFYFQYRTSLFPVIFRVFYVFLQFVHKNLTAISIYFFKLSAYNSSIYM